MMDCILKAPAIKDIAFTGGFLKGIQNKIVQEVIPYQWKALNDEIEGAEKSHCIENFEIAAGMKKGNFYGEVFQDSDLAKWMEAASYQLIHYPDHNLKQKLDDCLDLIEKAQLPDGYLNTYYIVLKPEKRWENLQECHELYCMGHFMEASIAYYIATDSRRFLEITGRMFESMAQAIGPEDGKIHGYPGHPEIEFALARMYVITGEEKYIEYAQYFVEERGKFPSFFDQEEEIRGYRKFEENRAWGKEYNQSHDILLRQEEAVGHVVRALYLYCGALETGRLKQRPDLITHLKTLWDNIVQCKMYVTGGIGSTHCGEAFTGNYDLPNGLAYNETCAAIAMAMFSYRLLLLTGDGKYGDILEREIYNGIIAGMAQDGKSFFYVNPLEVFPQYCEKNPDFRHIKTSRQKWFGCACCPPNLARFYMSLNEMVLSWYGSIPCVNLYGSYEGKWPGFSFEMETGYPVDGQIRIVVGSDIGREIRFRIPGWCSSFDLKINGRETTICRKRGYICAQIKNGRSDILLNLEMNPVRIRANDKNWSDAGKVAVMYGPVVYCLEEIDNKGQIFQLYLPEESLLEMEGEPVFDFPVITTEGKRRRVGIKEAYTKQVAAWEPQTLRFIPYFLWGNRGRGEMIVWIKEG